MYEKLTALVFLLTAIFASNCQSRPTGERWSIKDLIQRPNSFEEEFLDYIGFRNRPKRQAIGTTVTLNVRLQSKSRWFLAIKDNGTVEGSLSFNSPNVVLRLESVGKSVLRIYGIKAKKYLAMDSNGRLYSTTQLNKDTLFRQYLASSGFHTFSSATHLSQFNTAMYVALRDNGQPKKGSRTRKTHKSAQFLVIQVRK